MCRWMGWSGQPVLVEELPFKPKQGLVDQSLHSRMGVETTNGDGFGLGWYGRAGAGLYHSVAPAWGDANLRELARHIESPLFLAHVRATTGTAIQQTNCHPFRHGRWLFVHNGVIDGFDSAAARSHARRRPELFADIEGSTDSEVLFHLALTFGLEQRPGRGARAGDRVRRGDGGPARRRERDSGEHRRGRRRAPLGVPLLHGAAARARSSSAPRRPRSTRCTRRTRAPAPPRPGPLSSPSRSPTCEACGRSSPSRRS